MLELLKASMRATKRANLDMTNHYENMTHDQSRPIKTKWTQNQNKIKTKTKSNEIKTNARSNQAEINCVKNAWYRCNCGLCVHKQIEASYMFGHLRKAFTYFWWNWRSQYPRSWTTDSCWIQWIILLNSQRWNWKAVTSCVRKNFTWPCSSSGKKHGCSGLVSSRSKNFSVHCSRSAPAPPSAPSTSRHKHCHFVIHFTQSSLYTSACACPVAKTFHVFGQPSSQLMQVRAPGPVSV